MNVVRSLIKKVLAMFFATTFLFVFLTGCAGKNGEMGLTLDPSQKVMAVKIDRTMGPKQENVQRQCVQQVSAMRVAKGGAPLKAVTAGEDAGVDPSVASAAAGVGMFAIGTIGMVALLPAAIIHKGNKAKDDAWVQEELSLCINNAVMAEQEQQMKAFAIQSRNPRKK
jgi:hypothetical protein